MQRESELRRISTFSLMSLKRVAPFCDSETHKKLCVAINSIADEYICPITWKLPLHPVIAEDGRVYDHDAIKTYFDSQALDIVPSPCTRKMIGTRLIESTQIRNAIEQMVRSGAVDTDKAEEWIERIDNEDKFKYFCAKMNDDNVPDIKKLPSIYKIACCYAFGKGTNINFSLSFTYFERGLQICLDNESLWGKKYHAICLANMGICFLHGRGVDENKIYGISLITEAASMGVAEAAALLGDFYWNNSLRRVLLYDIMVS